MIVETREEARQAVMFVMAVTGWSLRNVARRSGVSPATLSRLLSKTAGETPYAKTLKAVASLARKIENKRRKKCEDKEVRHGSSKD
jgi:transcriptional regulator with XRE-family HTH domain